MHQSSIQVNIGLDDQKIPQHIKWSASDSTATEAQEARAMMLTFWDPTDKTALRIDLWTKDMMVDEMADFFYQNLMGQCGGASAVGSSATACCSICQLNSEV